MVTVESASGLSIDRINELNEACRKHASEQQASAVAHFAYLFYAEVDREELEERKLSDLYGAALSCWSFIQRHNIALPKVRVFNPEYEQHGWQSSHTVVEVLYRDIPFLFDTVNMEITRHGISIHNVHHTVLHVERDSTFHITNAGSLDHPSKNSHAEVVMHLEVDQHSDQVQLDRLAQSLQQLLQDSALVAADVDNMIKKVRLLEAKLENVIDASELKSQVPEVKEFLNWLVDRNFHFLGLDEYKLSYGDGAPQVSMVPSTSLGILKQRALKPDSFVLPDVAAVAPYIDDSSAIAVFKGESRSRILRPAYIDTIVIKYVDTHGQVCGGMRIVGLYHTTAYRDSPYRTPILKGKLKSVLQQVGWTENSYRYRVLHQVLSEHPFDELLQSSVEDLRRITEGIAKVQERRQVRLFIRHNQYSHFVSCLVYIPKDIFNTALRLKIQDVLVASVSAVDVSFATYFSESNSTRVYFVLKLNQAPDLDLDVKALEKKITRLSITWEDELYSTLIDAYGEELGTKYWHAYQYVYQAGYKENFSPQSAVADIYHLEQARLHKRLVMSFYRGLEDQADVVSFKLYNINGGLPLSDVIPILENLGLRVLGEHPYEMKVNTGEEYSIQDFHLKLENGEAIHVPDVKVKFQEAFAAIWYKQAENDALNRLVLSAKMHWREISLLRSYSRYFQQTNFTFSQSYIASTLYSNRTIASLLVKLFNARFNPETGLSIEERSQQAVVLEQELIKALEKVENLNEDRILRRYLEVINATLRCNFYQKDEADERRNKKYISLKLDPNKIPNLPLPLPMYEIFVYSPAFEGVHLRGGKVARGGLRWSDRLEDFRTEVLGLVKAQQVKNAVIVPVGAKGGFVVKKTTFSSSDERFAFGVTCYKRFISGLLDITDNLQDGGVVHPRHVVRYDDNDPYLVVAADKGTATFSDIANEIAQQRGFWLGDAFASGGSTGYDHKKMGITARGAWVSVQRHFREKGVNVQETPFTVIGIGDMSGDVFGNGMLSSEQIQLVAAFNHLHIFVDPRPDPKTSYAERERLMALPRSSWADYNTQLISAGGGIFSRSAKSVTITPEMQVKFDITDTQLTPAELIQALLKSSVDLIWNGGIGTYVKSSAESHSLVGDKANDVLRVNGNELQAKVVVEGGNLGLTQLSRVEYSLTGGALYTDFIDNAGGVDCSDHEVNIKILLNDIVSSEDMTSKQRNQLLEEMTEEVAHLVLQNNYRQTQAISLSLLQASDSQDEFLRYIAKMEKQGRLNRSLEFLPSDSLIKERQLKGQGFTQPELAVLISYAKAEIKEALFSPIVVSDKYMQRAVFTSFPDILTQRFSQAITDHRLRGEIIATQIANDIVNRMGIIFVTRLQDATGASIAQIARAYVITQQVFDIDKIWKAIEDLDYQVDSSTQYQMMIDIERMVRRVCRSLLRQHRSELDIAEQIAYFQPGVSLIVENIDSLLKGASRERYGSRLEHYTSARVPDLLAQHVSALSYLSASLDIIDVAEAEQQTVLTVASLYFQLGSQLYLDWFVHQITLLNANSKWQVLARESLRDDVGMLLRNLTRNLVRCPLEDEDTSICIKLWIQQNNALVQRWFDMREELRAADRIEFSMYMVAIRELVDLEQGSSFSRLSNQRQSLAIPEG